MIKAKSKESKSRLHSFKNEDVCCKENDMYVNSHISLVGMMIGGQSMASEDLHSPGHS